MFVNIFYIKYFIFIEKFFNVIFWGIFAEKKYSLIKTIPKSMITNIEK